MAAGYVTRTGVFALTTGHKTCVNLISTTAKTVLIVEMGISFDGVTASAVPVLVDIGYSTQATAGTNGGTPTPTQVRGRGTALITTGIKFTAEPTVLTPYKDYYVTPNGGLFVLQSPLGREANNDLTTGTNDAIFLGANPPASVNTVAYLEHEEE